MSPAPKKNKNACKSFDDLRDVFPLYIEHRAKGYSKKSFVECDYRTLEKYLEQNVDLHPLKKELERADREGLKYWEEIGRKITTGELRGNPATWIFTMKNKYPDDWQDTQKIDTTVNIPTLPDIHIE
jgi:hypothetical protein